MLSEKTNPGLTLMGEEFVTTYKRPMANKSNTVHPFERKRLMLKRIGFRTPSVNNRAFGEKSELLAVKRGKLWAILKDDAPCRKSLNGLEVF